ncbi:MAG: hypothetical protein JOZ62_22195 [Acidobacteriaceae bacterium]|nr:hypothetical protein [Acidobacteriaceae bacterium]
MLAISVPGRLNLMGEHIDYHGLAVLPIALQRHISIAFRRRPDRQIHVVSQLNGQGELVGILDGDSTPAAPGDWMNYISAAVIAGRTRWNLNYGMDAAIASDLPAAAGLSSSSALLTAVLLALLAMDTIRPSFKELMEILPEAEQFVGTRGGAMDHAAILASRAGHALLVEFDPVEISHIPIPDGWSFLVSHSMMQAEKSGAVRAEFNARREAGVNALRKLGFSSYRAAIQQNGAGELTEMAAEQAWLGNLTDTEMHAFQHVVMEATRVDDALSALRNSDAAAFGNVLTASHASLRSQLRVSTPDLDRLVDLALEAGALGARLSGAGFGGCAVVFCARTRLEQVREGLIERYFAGRPDFDPEQHLFEAVPSRGALG